MQQTVDADANVTKDLTDVDAVLETILVSGLSYFFSSVAAVEITEADADATTAVSGSSSCYSSAADGETMAEAVAVITADVAATICAAKI